MRWDEVLPYLDADDEPEVVVMKTRAKTSIVGMLFKPSGGGGERPRFTIIYSHGNAT